MARRASGSEAEASVLPVRSRTLRTVSVAPSRSAAKASRTRAPSSRRRSEAGATPSRSKASGVTEAGSSGSSKKTSARRASVCSAKKGFGGVVSGAKIALTAPGVAPFGSVESPQLTCALDGPFGSRRSSETPSPPHAGAYATESTTVSPEKSTTASPELLSVGHPATSRKAVPGKAAANASPSATSTANAPGSSGVTASVIGTGERRLSERPKSRRSNVWSDRLKSSTNSGTPSGGSYMISFTTTSRGPGSAGARMVNAAEAETRVFPKKSATSVTTSV